MQWCVLNLNAAVWKFLQIITYSLHTTMINAFTLCAKHMNLYWMPANALSSVETSVACRTWRRHQMETFSVLLALCAGNLPVTGEFPSQRASDAELWCFLWSAPCINGWVNNREAGDLRRHRGHYDVIAMIWASLFTLHKWLWRSNRHSISKLRKNNASQWLWPRFVFWLWFDKACSTHMLQLIHQLWGNAP